MIEIFLGNPPPAIKKWIMENAGSTPPAGAERWVEPVYTDEWVWSDGMPHMFDFADTDGDGLSSWILDGSYAPEDYENEFLTYIHVPEFQIGPTEVNGYRKYIPGHWEDADGNWINGSWDTPDYLVSVKTGYTPKIIWGEWSTPGWYDESTDVFYGDDRNINYIHDGSLIWIRTWNNTKPAPAA